MTRREKILQDALRDIPAAIMLAQNAAITAAAEDATNKDKATKAAAEQDATTKANAAMQLATAVPSRIRQKRLTISALAAGVGGTIEVVWDTPMPTTNYNVTPPLILGTALLSLTSVTNLTKTGCTVTLKNISLTNLLGGTATLHVLAIHDPL